MNAREFAEHLRQLAEVQAAREGKRVGDALGGPTRGDFSWPARWPARNLGAEPPLPDPAAAAFQHALGTMYWGATPEGQPAVFWQAPAGMDDELWRRLSEQAAQMYVEQFGGNGPSPRSSP